MTMKKKGDTTIVTGHEVVTKDQTLATALTVAVKATLDIRAERYEVTKTVTIAGIVNVGTPDSPDPSGNGGGGARLFADTFLYVDGVLNVYSLVYAGNNKYGGLFVRSKQAVKVFGRIETVDLTTTGHGKQTIDVTGSLFASGRVRLDANDTINIFTLPKDYDTQFNGTVNGGAFNLYNNAHIDFFGGVGGGASIHFAKGSSANVFINKLDAFDAPIYGFKRGDSIEIRDPFGGDPVDFLTGVHVTALQTQDRLDLSITSDRSNFVGHIELMGYFFNDAAEHEFHLINDRNKLPSWILGTNGGHALHLNLAREDHTLVTMTMT